MASFSGVIVLPNSSLLLTGLTSPMLLNQPPSMFFGLAVSSTSKSSILTAAEPVPA